MPAKTGSSHTRTQMYTHTSICQRNTQTNQDENALQLHHTVPHTHAWAPSQPSPWDHNAIRWAVLNIVGRTFSFIGLPGDVIVLSVCIGPLPLSHIMVYWSVTSKARVHYPHPLLLKTSRPYQGHKRTPAGTFYYFWEHQPHTLLERYGVDGSCCNHKGLTISIFVR